MYCAAGLRLLLQSVGVAGSCGVVSLACVCARACRSPLSIWLVRPTYGYRLLHLERDLLLYGQPYYLRLEPEEPCPPEGIHLVREYLSKDIEIHAEVSPALVRVIDVCN